MPALKRSVSVRQESFDLGVEMRALSEGRTDIGAVASFVGLVRDLGHEATQPLLAMTLEHYPGMTEQALQDIVVEAEQRWSLLATRVIHRYGRLLPGDPIVLVLVAASHRGEAFAACEFIMDYLKTRAPFWKKEATEAGGQWVDARDADDAAASRWDLGQRGGSLEK